MRYHSHIICIHIEKRLTECMHAYTRVCLYYNSKGEAHANAFLRHSPLVPDKEKERRARLIIARDTYTYLRKGQVALFLPLPIVTPNVNSRCKYSPADAYVHSARTNAAPISIYNSIIFTLNHELTFGQRRKGGGV